MRSKQNHTPASSADLRTIRLLRAVLAVATAAGIGITLKLWLASHRLFPLTPVWSGLPQPAFPWDVVLVVLLLASLAAAGFAPRAGPFIKVFLALTVLFAALDQCRWQPWILQYVVMFGALLVLPWNLPLHWTERNTADALGTCRIFMAWTYFYSGLHKLGYGFVIVLAGMLLPMFQRLHLNTAWLTLQYLFPAALLLGLVECVSGAMLVFRRTRSLAVVCLVMMHLSLLLFLGPLGLNWNYAIWPWNLAMVALLRLLFPPNSPWDLRALARSHPYAKAVAVAFGVLPLLTLFGLWDSYLGFSLYSGNIKAASIYIQPKHLPELPELVRRHAKPDGIIEIDRWCEAELGAPLYPETRIFVSVGRQVASWLSPGSVVRVIEVDRPNRLTGRRKVTNIEPWFRAPQPAPRSATP